MTDSTRSRVPLEIWQNIFLLVLASEHIPVLAEAEPRFWRPPEPSSQFVILPRTPSTLSSVCVGWRSCAYGMPDIWNTLFVKVPKSMRYSDDMETPPQILELVKARLSLARSMPLKICLVSKDNATFGRSLLRAIIPFSQQWETIHFYTPPEVYSELKKSRADSFPNLLSFNIIPQVYSHGVDSNDTGHFDGVPIFNEVSSIRRFHTSLIPSSESPIYPQLEELHIRATQSETWGLAPVLERCSQLRVLTLSGYGVTTYTPSPPKVPQEVTLPRLETLIIEHPSGRGRLLDLLVLPSLKSLLLGGRTDTTGHGTHALFDAIERLKERSKVASIEYLWLYFEVHGMYPHMLVDFLRKNQSIRELRINETFKFFNEDIITPYFFATLSGRHDDGSNSISDGRDGDHHVVRSEQPRPLLCPKLESLHLATYGFAILENAELATFLEARCMGQIGAGRGRTNAGTTTSSTPAIHVDISIKRARAKPLPDAIKGWKEKGCLVDVNIVD